MKAIENLEVHIDLTVLVLQKEPSLNMVQIAQYH